MIQKSFSQSYQDLFALQNAKTTSYIDAGAAWPIFGNNTYLLELMGWTGVSFEKSSIPLDSWTKSNRKNPIKFKNDVLLYDFTEISKHYGYLSLDIDTPHNGFNALKKMINSGLSFDVITFEHDYYAYRDKLRHYVEAYLNDYGYKVAVDNVYPDRFVPDNIQVGIYETWFVSTSIDFDRCDYSDWKAANNPCFYDLDKACPDIYYLPTNN